MVKLFTQIRECLLSKVDRYTTFYFDQIAVFGFWMRTSIYPALTAFLDLEN